MIYNKHITISQYEKNNNSIFSLEKQEFFKRWPVSSVSNGHGEMAPS